MSPSLRPRRRGLKGVRVCGTTNTGLRRRRPVKVLVIGAGVVGTAAAWYLTKAGHEVTVLDRREGPGLETSFANGGQISACHAEPWANPAVLPRILRWLGREDAPLKFRFNRWDPALWAWSLRFLANCTGGRAAVNTERALRVALYSRRCLQQLRAETGIAYDHRTRGILHVYRDPREFGHARKAAELMRRHGLPRFDKTAAECAAIEPALEAVAEHLAGGIFTPEDESGDAYAFTAALVRLATARGAVFRTGIKVIGFETNRDRVTAVLTEGGRLRPDGIVLAAGVWSPLLARSAGLRLPVVPAKGYSVTIPVAGHGGAPTVSITDDEHKIVCSRLGERLRVAGTAEMAGYDSSLNQLRWRLILDQARALFPDGGDFERAEPWAGLRPVTPDSVPLLGATPFRNLWLDTGHGTLGWTMACGSGRVIADLVSGRKPEIALEGLELGRFC
ncbi:MAG: D-amino acid dehydrogenase [Magnetospirillum sp.]|nr:D-amino acid dehydrogenase [Magnetospirillum sp.]